VVAVVTIHRPDVVASIEAAAERLLTATAIERACPFITYDDRIVRFGHLHGLQYGFTARG
jgi:PIN domain nuclease of toxin-antitoxin system